MVLYGVAALALCMLAGTLLGELLGVALGIDANVGGVGFAMIMLIVATDWLRRKGKFPKPAMIKEEPMPVDSKPEKRKYKKRKIHARH